MTISDDDLRGAQLARVAHASGIETLESGHGLGQIARTIAASTQQRPHRLTEWAGGAVFPAVAIAFSVVIVIAFLGTNALHSRPPDKSAPAGLGSPTRAPSAPPSLPTDSASASAVQVNGCEALEFSPVRCTAVVQRARTQASPPIRADDIASTTLTPSRLDIDSLGSQPIADVHFELITGGSVDVPVKCWGIPEDSDRACNYDPTIGIRGGVNRDVPCATEAPGSCATLPPSPRPASVSASRPLVIDTFEIPLDHLGRYEVKFGAASLPDGALSEMSASVADPRPTSFWIDDGIRFVVRPDIAGRPPVGSIYRDPYDGPEPVSIYLLFDVVEVQPGAVLGIRGLVVR